MKQGALGHTARPLRRDGSWTRSAGPRGHQCPAESGHAANIGGRL